MTRMDCGEVRDLLPAYADDELAPAERRAVAAHLVGCPGCSGALAALEALRTAVKRAGTFAMPAALEAGLRASIGGAAATDRAPRWRRFARLAASHLAVAAVAGALAAAIVGRLEATDRALRDIVAAHVRSVIGGEPVQVASTDSHTVRPWFVGRLPYAPPVRDLGAQGFPLVGARLDHVYGRTSAALVYARRKHRINVFVVPSAGAPAGLPTGTRDGYSIVSWREGDFAFLAVSDLNAAELATFARLLRTADG
jgi:anti-sigma factor RsiW